MLRSNPGKNAVVVIVLVALAVGLVACGGSSGSAGTTTSEATQTTTEPTETTTASPPVSGPPLAVALSIDGTLRAGPKAREVKQSLAEFAEDTAILSSTALERGGSFKASIFGGPGAAITFKTMEFDPKDSLQRRYQQAIKHYGPIAVTVDQSLGQMPPSGATGKRLAALPPGTAVGEALREAVQEVHGKHGERWAVLATDGFDTTHGQLPLPNVQQTAKVLRQTVGNLDAHGVGIAMVGVGLAPHHNNWHQDGPLTKAWAIVCHEIHARECQIHADPRLPPPLESTAHAITEGV